MDALTLARIQFGSTIVYHFFFVPLTLGLVVLVAIMETLYVWSGNPIYKRMTQFWGKLFLINFAMGVVTGIVQEFQFGMNWSTYSRFIGDVFGAPLAIEGLLAFFMESTFLGIWLFSWEQLNKKLHAILIWMVALGSYFSAFWILVANSFMQQPVGYTMHNGRAEMNDFLALLTNPHLWAQFPHVVAAGLITGAFFVVGISAYHLLKKIPAEKTGQASQSTSLAVAADRHKALSLRHQDFFRRSMTIGLCVALLGSIAVSLFGDMQGKEIAQSQPMKMASMEALWNTESPASFSLFTVGNQTTNSDIVAIKVPYVLSILAHDSFTTPVPGINQLQAEYVKKYGPGNYIPPVIVTYWGFRFMVGAGMAMGLLAALGLFLLVKKQLFNRRWLLWIFVGAIALPYIGNTTGWIFTEMGRQPWLVFGVLKTTDGVSPNVSPAMVLTTLIIFIVLYGILAIVDVFLLSKFARKGLEEIEVEHNQMQEEEFFVSY